MCLYVFVRMETLFRDCGTGHFLVCNDMNLCYNYGIIFCCMNKRSFKADGLVIIMFFMVSRLSLLYLQKKSRASYMPL